MRLFDGITCFVGGASTVLGFVCPYIQISFMFWILGILLLVVGVVKNE